MSKKEEQWKSRKDWFQSQIGKTIYRNKIRCTCGVCEKSYSDGIFVIDEMHTDYLFLNEDIHGIRGRPPVKYFSTKEEVQEFVESLN